MKIRGVHHNAYRCRDSEETRAFYEDFLGLPLAEALAIDETKTGRKVAVLHPGAPMSAFGVGSRKRPYSDWSVGVE